MSQTEQLTDVNGPLFLSLKPPYEGLGVASISSILSDTIKEAGLSVRYTPRSFRTTGASAAIIAGNDPEVTRQIGRWKTREVFYDSYVYPLSEKSFTDKMFTANTST